MVGIQNKCFVNFKILRYVSIKSIRYELISVIKITIFIGVIVTSLELQIVRLKKKISIINYNILSYNYYS